MRKERFEPGTTLEAKKATFIAMCSRMSCKLIGPHLLFLQITMNYYLERQCLLKCTRLLLTFQSMCNLKLVGFCPFSMSFCIPVKELFHYVDDKLLRPNLLLDNCILEYSCGGVKTSIQSFPMMDCTFLI